jgi:hypothetical protein
MSILEKIIQAFIPVNQPKNFPRLYFIPDTTTVEAPRQASNDTGYHPLQNARHTHIRPQPKLTSGFRLNVPRPINYIRQMKARFHQRCSEFWSEMKAAGRRAVRWLVWRILVPLAVLASLSIPIVTPAELFL